LINGLNNEKINEQIMVNFETHPLGKCQ